MTITLTMIVKDESAVVARAIESVRPIIDSYAIIDTGSTDNTEEVAREALKGVHGEYARTEWRGYGPSRCLSLELANSVAWGKGYALIVDADDVWKVGAERPMLTADSHAVWCERPGARWTTTRFMRLGMGIRYEGVVHEMPVSADGKPLPAELLEGIVVTSPNDGATYRDPNKYLEHAKMIARAMVDDPANTRYAFYLAQSYRDHGDDERAAALYLARAAMGQGTYGEEVYCAYLEAGRAFWRLGRRKDAKHALLRAHQAYPGRREAMAELARLFALECATTEPVGTLFVELGLGGIE